jgi:superfamily II DNA or RNA helicase
VDTIATQKLQHPAIPGSIVRVRGATWRVIDVTPGERCRALRLRCLHAPPGVAAERVLLEPFDRCEVLPSRRRERLVSRRAWVCALAATLTSAERADVPAAAALAHIELWPYQLEPAMAVLRGEAARVLIADPVGLGKTIQAGLILAELHRRGQAAHVLVVVPAGLREQWRQELDARFGIEATWCDAAWLGAQTARLPPGVNPWSPPAVRLVSMDFVKRLETLNGIDELVWDLLIVDEAHSASAGSDRRAAVNALARRSRRVVLATATPHGGDSSAFDALCSIGCTGPSDHLSLFRRPRRVLAAAVPRRVALLRVRRTPDEQRMDRLLADYAGLALEGPLQPAARLAVGLLLKRAWSSARALELTALRRRELLATGPPEPEPVCLPFEDTRPGAGLEGDEVTDQVLRIPALPNVRHEIARMGAIVEAARRASRSESKLRALARLLRRTSEPAIVFTEYRDTLAVVLRVIGDASTAVLHGGQGTEDRRQALSAFASGRARILLATDAASEGLNLHARCRRVVLLELPWTPARVEQRVGRVDRLGQQRPVHAVYLVARDTPEEHILGRHAIRLAEIRRRLGSLDEATGRPAAVDRFVRACWQEAAQRPGVGQPTEARSGTALATHARLSCTAVAASQWLDLLRRLVRRRRGPGAAERGGTPSGTGGEGLLVTALRLRRPLAGAAQGVLLVVRVELGEADRPPLDIHVVPVLCRATGGAMRRRRATDAVSELLAGARPLVEARVAESLAPRVEEVFEAARRNREAEQRREASIHSEQSRAAALALLQPDLFERAPARRLPPIGPGAMPHGSQEGAFQFRSQVVLAAVFHVR